MTTLGTLQREGTVITVLLHHERKHTNTSLIVYISKLVSHPVKNIPQSYQYHFIP